MKRMKGSLRQCNLLSLCHHRLLKNAVSIVKGILLRFYSAFIRKNFIFVHRYQCRTHTYWSRRWALLETVNLRFCLRLPQYLSCWERENSNFHICKSLPESWIKERLIYQFWSADDSKMPVLNLFLSNKIAEKSDSLNWWISNFETFEQQKRNKAHYLPELFNF